PRARARTTFHRRRRALVRVPRPRGSRAKTRWLAQQQRRKEPNAWGVPGGGVVNGGNASGRGAASEVSMNGRPQAGNGESPRPARFWHARRRLELGAWLWFTIA